MEHVWLVSGGRVLASARLAETRGERRRGLIGLDRIDEPLVIEECSWVHSFGMRSPIDVAHLAHDGTVIATGRLRPWRPGRPVRGASRVVEAAPGSFERWSLVPGDVLEVRRVDG